MKRDRHSIASMTRFALRCSCGELFRADDYLREQPAINAFNYLLDQHKAHRQYAKNRGLLEEGPSHAHDDA